jgi:hypothetical protein
MKLPTKIPIDMREVCRTGRFDCLRIGQTKELILSNFPDPDGFVGEERRSRSLTISTSGSTGTSSCTSTGLAC